MRIELFDVRDRERLRAALALRFEVFVDEQGVPADEEADAHDRDDLEAVHAIVTDENGIVAAGRFYPAANRTAQIGRMVVARSARRRGVGALLLETLMAEARSRGYECARLDAQLHAVPFYAKAGFEPCADRLVDAGIVHQPMSRRLDR